MAKDERKKVAVRATAEGFFGGARRRKGDTFFVPEGVVGKWFVPTDPSQAAVSLAALEEAEKAKVKAKEVARQRIVDAELALREIKTQTGADLRGQQRVADAEAKKKVLGGLYSKPVETEEYKANVEADKASVDENADLV